MDSGTEDWTWSLNYSKIRDDIYIGSCPITIEDVRILKENIPATAVLSLQHPECHGAFGIVDNNIASEWKTLGVEYIRVPMRDFDQQSQHRNLPLAVKALATMLQNNNTVYVHCTAGINRSSLVVVAYLVLFEHFTDQQAVELLRQSRPEVEPYMDVFWAFRTGFAISHYEKIRESAYNNYLSGSSDDFLNWLNAERQTIRNYIMNN